MKVRVISGIIGALIFAVIMCFVNTPVFAVAVSFISAVAVFEVLRVIKCDRSELLIPCVLYAFLFPLKVYVGSTVATAVTVLAVIAVLVIQLIKFEKISFSETAESLFVMLALPFAFASLVFLRDGYGGIASAYLKNEGVFYIIIAFLSAWGTDTAAYFSGCFLGRHKLCPKISPKKTVEGAVGGVLGCILINIIATVVYNVILGNDGHYSLLMIIPISFVLSVAGMCGDLTASVVKRNFNVKDYGKIMPGHGGVMDRFDSVTFAAPVLYALLLIVK